MSDSFRNPEAAAAILTAQEAINLASAAIRMIEQREFEEATHSAAMAHSFTGGLLSVCQRLRAQHWLDTKCPKVGETRRNC